MIRSMTGFGEEQRETSAGLLTVQIRTVNHKGFHTHFRLPAGAERWEADLTGILREGIARGHVHVRMTYQATGGAAGPVQVHHGRLAAYLETLREIKERYGVMGEVDLSLITRFGDVFQAAADELESLASEDVGAATRAALAMVVEMREREGRILAQDLLESLGGIRVSLKAIDERAPGRLLAERDRLRSAVAELAGDIAVDEDRLAREVAYLAERWDINEEIVRLRSHMDQFGELVESDGSEPAGKRLGFWVQEMHREANTIGSKANDGEIARLVIDIKTAIDRLREQVENVE